jgi:hypothetical protein
MDGQHYTRISPSWYHTSQLNLHAVQQGYNVLNLLYVILCLGKTNKADFSVPRQYNHYQSAFCLHFRINHTKHYNYNIKLKESLKILLTVYRSFVRHTPIHSGQKTCQDLVQ